MFQRVLTVATVAALLELAGCGSNQQFSPLSAVSTAASRDTGRSSLRLGADTIKELAYVSDRDTGAVHVYAYPSGKLERTLTGFAKPGGQCVDRAGDVFITDFAARTVMEFAHGGKKPMQTLSTAGSPNACSVAPNGDLAVANNNNATSGGGDIAVFKKASGSPKHYSNSVCPEPVALGYDGLSNLYVMSGYSSAVCEIKHKTTSMNVVKSNVTINSPIGVMWDGKHITLADDYYPSSVTETVIYQMKESAFGDLSEVGKTVLTDKKCNNRSVAYQPFLLGATNTPSNKQLATLVVGANTWCMGSLFTWPYTKGGNPVGSFKTATNTAGQSISIAP